MKRIFIIAVLFLSCVISNAQDERPIPRTVDENTLTPTVGSTNLLYSYVALVNLAAEWKKIVKATPWNQQAWRNLFFATFLAEKNSLTKLNTDDKKNPQTALVLRKMKEAVPNSYVFNLCACHFWIESEWGIWDKKILRDAVKLIPADAYDEDILRLAKMLWKKDCDNEKGLKDLYRRIYDRRFYPYKEMRYGWNLLQSMSHNAIFIAHDDMELEPVKIIQEVLGERQDVTVIPCQYITNREFTDEICRKFHIKRFALKKKADVSKEEYVEQFTMHLIKETNRPLYQPFDMINYSNLCMDSLYNEGLLMKYSNKRYDNISVLLHNLKEVYDLKYMTEPSLVQDNTYFDNMDEDKILLTLAYVVKLFRKRGLETEAQSLYRVILESIHRNENYGFMQKLNDLLPRYGLLQPLP